MGVATRRRAAAAASPAGGLAGRPQPDSLVGSRTHTPRSDTSQILPRSWGLAVRELLLARLKFTGIYVGNGKWPQICRNSAEPGEKTYGCTHTHTSDTHACTTANQRIRLRSPRARSVMAAWHHCSTVVRRVGTLIAAMVAQQAPLSWSSSGAAIVNCTLNDTVRGGTIYTGTSPYSIGGWDGKDWQSCASFCQTDPIGGHPCMAWELIPNYKVINTTHPLACLFYATVPDCVKTQASAAVTGCGSKGFAANPEKCCGGGHCAVVGFQCTGAAGLYQCVPATLANGTMFPDRAACLQQCRAPPPPPPGPPPPPPAYSKPYIRFANVVPVSNLVVDCQITQGTTSHKWTRVAFGKFSPWI
eukprot:COSAG01_NODE_14759_length_1413_cov_2.024353_1_plen_358_part_01